VRESKSSVYPCAMTCTGVRVLFCILTRRSNRSIKEPTEHCTSKRIDDLIVSHFLAVLTLLVAFFVIVVIILLYPLAPNHCNAFSSLPFHFGICSSLPHCRPRSLPRKFESKQPLHFLAKGRYATQSIRFPARKNLCPPRRANPHAGFYSEERELELYIRSSGSYLAFCRLVSSYNFCLFDHSLRSLVT